MRTGKRFLLGISGLMLVASGAKQFVHELSNGVPAPPALAHHAGTATATAFAHGEQMGFIFGEQTAFALKLLCGAALLAWCLRDTIRNRAASSRTVGAR